MADLVREVVPVLLADGSAAQWEMSIDVDGSAFRLELRATDGREWAAEGVGVYASLRVLRRQLEQDDIAIGCNGALPNARPSPFAARCGGGLWICCTSGVPRRQATWSGLWGRSRRRK